MLIPVTEAFGSPARLWTRREVLQRSSPVPCAPGIYGWFLRNLPDNVPLSGTVTIDGFHLLYIGIAPARPGSASNLRTRVRQHLAGNASGSTLRLTLGCLLSEQLRLVLSPTASGRLTFGSGESRLSEWFEQNSRIVWHTIAVPWTVEAEAIQSFVLPLNIRDNDASRFAATVSALRCAAKAAAH